MKDGRDNDFFDLPHGALYFIMAGLLYGVTASWGIHAARVLLILSFVSLLRFISRDKLDKWLHYLYRPSFNFFIATITLLSFARGLTDTANVGFSDEGTEYTIFLVLGATLMIYHFFDSIWGFDKLRNWYLNLKS